MDNIDPRMLAMLRLGAEQPGPQGNGNAAPGYMTGDAAPGSVQPTNSQPLGPIAQYIPPKSPFDTLGSMGMQSAMNQQMMDNNSIAQGGKAADSSKGYGAMGRGLNSLGESMVGGLKSAYGGMGKAFSGMAAF